MGTIPSPILEGGATGLATDGTLQMSQATLVQEVRRILDQQSSLEDIGVVENVGTINGNGSVTMDIPYMDLDGRGGMQPVSETGVATYSSIVGDKVTLSVTRYSNRRSISDLAKGTSKTGTDVERLANIATAEVRRQKSMDIAKSWAAGSQVVGVSGSAMSLAKLYEAEDLARIRKIPAINGQYWIVVLSDQQANELVADVRAQNAVLRERTDIQEFSKLKVGDFEGFLGNVAVFRSADVQDDGTDFAGGLIGQGAIVSAYLEPELPPQGNWAVKFGGINGYMLEMDREAGATRTEIISNLWHGFSIRDERVVRIRSAV